MLSSHYAPKARLRLNADGGRARRSAARLRPAPAASRHAQSVAARRSDRSGGQSVFASARARCFRRQAHRGNESAARGPGRSDQRPAGARRRAESRRRTHEPTFQAAADARARARPARPLRRHRRRQIRDHRPAGAASPIWSRCATSITARRRWCCGRGSVDEVAAILKLANETKTAIVPQGGNTGLVGGQIPHHGEVVLVAHPARQDPRGRCGRPTP